MANGDLVGILVRGMDIVKLVGESPDGMWLWEIAAALKLKIPTCCNLVWTLTAGGFLEKRNMRFFFGPELLRLAGQQPGRRWNSWPNRNSCYCISGGRAGRWCSPWRENRGSNRRSGSVLGGPE